MYNPCFECMNRYGKQYTEECDNTCNYAQAVKERNNAISALYKTISNNGEPCAACTKSCADSKYGKQICKENNYDKFKWNVNKLLG